MSDSENEVKTDENKMPISQQALEYLERHQIYELFANLTANLAIDRPSNIKQYLIQKLRTSQNHKIFLICNDSELAMKCANILNSQLMTPIHSINTDTIDSDEWNNKITALQKANKFILVNCPQNRKMALKLLECRIIPDRVLLVTRQPIEKVQDDCTPIALLSFKDIFAYRTRFVCVTDNDETIDNQLLSAVLSQQRSANSKAPQIPPRVIVIGPMYDVNSKLALYLETNLNLRYLHPNAILQSHIQFHSKYGIQAEKTTAPNGTISDDLLAEMMANDIADPQNKILSSGWVLVDYPHSSTQAQTLVKYGIQPSRVIIINPPPNSDVVSSKNIEADKIERAGVSVDENGIIDGKSIQKSFDDNIGGIKEELSFKDSNVCLFHSAVCDPNNEKEMQRVFELARDFVVQPLPQSNEQ